MKTIITTLFLMQASALLFAQLPMYDQKFDYNQADAKFGQSVANAGDLNGDGYTDLAIGVSDYTNGQTEEGAVFIYYGSASGFNATPDLILERNQSYCEYGFAVAGAGDVNADGYDDLIVSAYQFTNGQSGEGRIFIYSGSASGLVTTPAVTMESNQASGQMGYSVACAGDVNNDGYDDVVVGAPYYDYGQIDEGRVYIYTGSPVGIIPFPVAILEMNQASAYFGESVASAGDVNNDGYDDIIVGAYFYDNGQTNEGGAFIYYGNASGVSTTPATSLEGEQNYAAFGNSVACAGDVNSDGYDDVIVGAHSYWGDLENNGRIYIYHGSATGISTSPNTIVEGDIDYADFGDVVATAGDYNGDGYDDVLVGASAYDFTDYGYGRSFILLGSAFGVAPFVQNTMNVDQGRCYFGNAVASMGDLNGDGMSDVIVGSYGYDDIGEYDGAAFIYYGENCTSTAYYYDYDADGFGDLGLKVIGCFSLPAGFSANADDCNDEVAEENPNTIWYFDSDSDGYYAGDGSPIIQCDTPGTSGYYYNLIGGGDCDDTFSGVYPGANEQPDGKDNDCNGDIDEGLEWTYGGILEANQSSSNYGASVSDAGDVNGDGYADLIIGAYSFHNGQSSEGMAFIYHGSASGVNNIAAATMESDQVTAYFGNAVSGAGDVNGDGYDDVIVGAYNYDNGQTDEGRAYIFHGSATGIITTPAATLEADQAAARFGDAVSGAGDLNGDGYDDVVVGAKYFDNGQTDEGRAYVYLGSASGIVTTPSIILESDQATSYFGYAVSGAGDINNDGYDDLLISAYNYDNGQTNEGRVYIYHGSATGITATPAITVESNQAYSGYGTSLSSAGDINGDNYDDIVVGSTGFTNGQTAEGGAYMYHGSATGIGSSPAIILEGNNTYMYFGRSVSDLGDVDGDGYDDIIVGAEEFAHDQIGEGGCFIYHGSASGINPIVSASMESDQEYAEFGESVSGAGDLNGDGYNDVVVGAMDYDNVPVDEGVAFVYYSLQCVPTAEICNAVDDNCNGLIDDGIVETISIAAGGATIFCQGGSVSLTATYSGTSLQWKKNGATIAGATNTNYSANKTGNYTCVTTSACGSATSNTINVTVNKNPAASITAGGSTTFCAGGSVTLNEAPVAGCSYQWYKGASTIAGATTTSYVATTAGNYKCRVTKIATGCFKNSNAITVTVPCRESESITNNSITDNPFTIYPNPATETLTIETGTEDEKIFLINDALGNLVRSVAVDGNISTIDIHDLPAGMYTIRIGDTDSSVHAKFIKQ